MFYFNTRYWTVQYLLCDPTTKLVFHIEQYNILLLPIVPPNEIFYFGIEVNCGPIPK